MNNLSLSYFGDILLLKWLINGKDFCVETYATNISFYMHADSSIGHVTVDKAKVKAWKILVH